MRPNFALYGAAAVALVTLATVAEATPSYESDYGHVDEYKSNNYKHEAKYPSSYESDDYKHETSGGSGHFEPHKPYGSHYEENYGHEEDSGYEEDYGHEEYRPSHYQPKYSMAPSYKHKPSYDGYSADEDYARSPSYKHQPSYDSYSADEDYGYEEYTEEASYKHQPSHKHQPSYRHRRSVGYGSPYGSQSYKHKPSDSPKQSVGYGSPYAERPSYRHRRSVDGLDTFVNAVSDSVSSTIQAHADGKKAKVDFVKGLFSKRSVDAVGDGAGVNSTVVREGQQARRYGEDCWVGCNGKQGHCNWCPPRRTHTPSGAKTDCCPRGLCCRRGRKGNGCSGNMGGKSNHMCVKIDCEPTKGTRWGEDCFSGCCCTEEGTSICAFG